MTAVFLAQASSLRSENQFESFGLKQLGNILSNPPLFFYEFQRNTESTFPLPPGKRFGVNTHLFGGIIVIPLPDVTTVFNVSGKVRLHPESRLAPGLPQVDFVGGYWDSLLTSLIENKGSQSTDSSISLKKVTLGGHYAAVVFTSSLEPRLRLFWSYKFSRMNTDLQLNKAALILGSSATTFKSDFTEHTLAAGVEHTYGKNTRWLFEGGYGVKNNLLSAKVSWYHKYLEVGLNIYPESVFIMQPQVNFHFNF